MRKYTLTSLLLLKIPQGRAAWLEVFWQTSVLTIQCPVKGS
uniref:Uncharacterized protein n=1 Tax=Setaria viridis TaxID=4556 RepID=A0A4U6TUF0_SETVI|nr:hypothetical protein SEVIR_8G170950v2 [Setaria viridis]